MAYFNSSGTVFLRILDPKREKKAEAVLALPSLLNERILNYSIYLFSVRWIVGGNEGRIMKKVLDKIYVMGIIALTLNQLALYIFFEPTHQTPPTQGQIYWAFFY
jgi:hypothetical protein